MHLIDSLSLKNYKDGLIIINQFLILFYRRVTYICYQLNRLRKWNVLAPSTCSK